MPRILYIEDDLNNRILVRRVLLAAGFDVEDVDNAQAGIEKAYHNPPDLILMDVSMPQMDGLTATARIRNIPELSHIPIVALTANVMQGDRERSIAAGCNGYIPKPIDVDNFPNQVAQYLIHE